MDSWADLPMNIQAVLSAYNVYQTAVAKDEISTVEPSAKLPDAEVFVNGLNSGLIIILPERHDSADPDVKGGALAVAKKVLVIPKVKIAVEEPVLYNGTLLSNVGWSKDIMKKPQSTSLFDYSESAEGSISHQIYVRQVGGAMIGTSRYPAENMPRNPQRYNNPEINVIMAVSLILNTNAGDVSVYPVGPDHLLARYDLKTLAVHLKSAGWKKLTKT